MTKRTKVFFRILDFSLLAVFHSTRLLSRLLPPPLLYPVVGSTGRVVFRLHPSMREHLLENLRVALPGVTDRHELEKIGKQACGAPFLLALQMFIFEKYGERIMRDLRIEGMEHLERADAEGKGVILITAHLGAVPMVLAILSRLGKPFTPLAMHPSDTTIPHFMMNLIIFAQILGCDREQPVIWTKRDDTRSKVREHLGKGGRVGITFDIGGSTVIDFLGRPTGLASGIAHFALDTGAPIVPGHILRGKRPLEIHAKLYEPLAFEPSGDRAADVKKIMAAVGEVGEAMIREAPGQWIGWFGLRQWRKMAEEKGEPEG